MCTFTHAHITHTHCTHSHMHTCSHSHMHACTSYVHRCTQESHRGIHERLFLWDSHASELLSGRRSAVSTRGSNGVRTTSKEASRSKAPEEGGLRRRRRRRKTAQRMHLRFTSQSTPQSPTGSARVHWVPSCQLSPAIHPVCRGQTGVSR